MNIANGPGATFRNDLNNALEALASNNSGAVAPSPTFPCQIWGDTGTGLLKQRDSANTLWITLGPLDTSMRYPGRLLNIQIFTANSTYTPTTGMKNVLVKFVGGGGGTGTANATSASQVSAAGGGASGSYGEAWLTSATIGASQSVVIGAAGVGGSGTAGGAGGTTSLGSILSAAGGGGGIAANAITTTASSLSPGGASGAITTGGTLLNTAGQQGDYGICVQGSALGGVGGSNPLGVGGNPGLSPTSGTGYGAGAGGPLNAISSAARAGVAGTAGAMFFYEYC